jgi:GTP pyrophosphokinase
MPNTKNRTLISDLCEVLEVYMSKIQVEQVYRAYIVAATAHDGQYRKSGEAYVFHPLSVAMILAKLQLDYYCVTAAILHDCIEDTSITYQEIKRDFGGEIAHIVEGVSKLTGLETRSHTEKQAQNFRKLLLAMSDDMRVIIIKLADRLHNMRTLGAMRRDKQLRIAKETSEIHTPIAHRLGLNSIKTELDELCFSIIFPYRHCVLTNKIKEECTHRKVLIEGIQTKIKAQLETSGMKNIEINGRRKQPFSIYKKMKIKRLKFSQVLDRYAFRVIVENVAQCYQALGVIHNLYKPLPGRFKDYIALPKLNGYQSLHTVLFGPQKIMIEVQIRSKDMHFISEYGIAAHWHYKNSANNRPVSANHWVGSLFDIQKNTNTAVEFLEASKNDLSPSEVFVFTPKGEIIQLPYNATALDFAYTVHTNIGAQALKAHIDQVSRPISSTLKSGQTIEIITSLTTKPHPFWLDFVVTSKAKSAIKSSLKQGSTAELMHLGKQLLDDSFDYQGIDKDIITDKQWLNCLSALQCESKDILYMHIGLSEILANQVLHKLGFSDSKNSAQSITLKDTKGKLVSFSPCCYPIPGDKVSGVLNANKGLLVHRNDCINMMRIKRKNLQWLEIDWQASASEDFNVVLLISIQNQRGVLASVASTIAQNNANIESLEIQEKDSLFRALLLRISLNNTQQLQGIIQQLNQLEHVSKVKRV